MRTPKARKMYDVCVMSKDTQKYPADVNLRISILYRHLRTPVRNMPFCLARYTATQEPKAYGEFTLIVPNGKNPVQFIAEKHKNK